MAILQLGAGGDLALDVVGGVAEGVVDVHDDRLAAGERGLVDVAQARVQVLAAQAVAAGNGRIPYALEDVTFLSPFTVDEGRPRALRVTLTALHTPEDIDGLVEALARTREPQLQAAGVA